MNVPKTGKQSKEKVVIVDLENLFVLWTRILKTLRNRRHRRLQRTFLQHKQVEQRREAGPGDATNQRWNLDPLYLFSRMKILGISASCVQVNPLSNFPFSCKPSTHDDHTPFVSS